MDIPRFIDVQMQDGTYVSVFVEVPLYPQKCSHCSIFGHIDKACPKKSAGLATKVWVPKNKQNVVSPNERSKGDNLLPKHDWVSSGNRDVSCILVKECDMLTTK